jgi:hypothetical protein
MQSLWSRQYTYHPKILKNKRENGEIDVYDAEPRKDFEQAKKE